MLRRRLQVLKDRVGAAVLLRILCLHSQWSGTTLPGPTELALTNPPVCTSERKELSPKEGNSVCSTGRPPRNDKLEILKSLVWVLQLKKNFGLSYVQRTTPASSPDISPGLGLSSSINYILYAQVNLITHQNYSSCHSLQIKYT